MRQIGAALPTQGQAILGNTISWLGDSHVAGSTDAANLYFADAFPTYAEIIAAGRLRTVGYHGIGGERSDQIRARVTAALAQRPALLAVEAGTNDIGQGIDSGMTDDQILAQIRTNLVAIYDAARAAGAVPVACTLPPNNAGDRRKRLIAAANAWLKAYTMARGIPLVDFWAILTKDGLAQTPAGNWRDEYASDGTHANPAGRGAMGRVFVTTLAPLLPTRQPYLVRDTADQVNLIRNPLFAENVGDPKKGDAWYTYGAPTSSTTSLYSLVTDPLIPGRMQQIQQLAGSDLAGLASSATTASATAGDRMAVALVVTTDGGVAWSVIVNTGGKAYRPASMEAGTAITRGVVYLEFLAQATGTLDLNLLVGGGVGTIAYGQITLINLTQLGL